MPNPPPESRPSTSRDSWAELRTSKPRPAPLKSESRRGPGVSGSSGSSGAQGSPKLPEPQYTVYIRLPFPRGSFVDPPRVDWDVTKERILWKELSKRNRSTDLDWDALSAQLQVSRAFLLQQAAWLYERELSQIQAAMRKVGVHGSGSGSSSSSMLASATPASPVLPRSSTTPLAPKPPRPTTQLQRFTKPPPSESEYSSSSSSSSSSDSDSEAPTTNNGSSRNLLSSSRNFLSSSSAAEDEDEDEEEDDNFLPFAAATTASSENMAGTVTLLRPQQPQPQPQPRRPAQIRRGADSAGPSSPSMGSSFSDLSDASVSQSAMEEAYLSTLNAGGGGGMASRLGLGQAVISGYFQSQR